MTLQTVDFPFDINKLIDLCRQHGVETAAVFGSMSRGEAKENSDLDLLVTFSRRIGLLELVRLERELSIALNIKVDLLTKEAISPYIRDQILAEARLIYEA